MYLKNKIQCGTYNIHGLDIVEKLMGREAADLLSDISDRLLQEDKTLIKFRNVYQSLADEKLKENKIFLKDTVPFEKNLNFKLTAILLTTLIAEETRVNFNNACEKPCKRKGLRKCRKKKLEN